ncbi:MAG: hypothetical protein RR214_04560 [Synergistaceae bacterium]
MNLHEGEKVEGLKGRLCIKVLRDGKEITWAQDNLIVTSGRANLAKLLGGNTGMHIAKFAIGECATAPVPGDTTLTNPVSVDITEVRIGTDLEAEDGTTFADARIVQFHFRMPTTTGIGTTIREYGLIAADGSLFSRIAREHEFVKTSIDQIVGYWQIQF